MACYFFALGSIDTGFVVGVVGSHVDSYAPAEDVQAVDVEIGAESDRGGGSEEVRHVVVVETEDQCHHGKCDGC